MSTLSASRPTPTPNSRLTGDRQTPTAGAIVRHAPEKLIFHGAKREQDVTPPARRVPLLQSTARYRRENRQTTLLAFNKTMKGKVPADYSSRSAVIGLIVAALRAGTHAAASATVSNAASDSAAVSGSSGSSRKSDALRL